MDVGRIEARVVAVVHGQKELDKFGNEIVRVRGLTKKDITANFTTKADDRGLTKFHRKITETNDAAKGLRGGLLGSTGAMVGMSGAAGAAAGAVAGMYAAFSVGKASITQTVDLAKSTTQLSTTMRLGAADASQWAELLKAFGIDSGTASVGFGRMATMAERAAKGNKTAGDNFRTLGFRTREFSNLKPDVVLRRVADLFHGKQPTQSQLAAAAQVLGRNFRNLLPILRQGSEGIDKNLQLIRKYGAYLGKDATSSVKKFREKQREMTYAFDAMKLSIGTALMPVLTDLIPKIGQVVEGFTKGKGPYADTAKSIKNIAGVALDLAAAFVDITSSKEGLVLTIGAIGLAFAVANPEIAAVLGLLISIKTTIDYLSGSNGGSSIGDKVSNLWSALTGGDYDPNMLGSPNSGSGFGIGNAAGGRIPGTPVAADSVPAMLSPGEFVVTGDGEKRLENMTFPGVLNWLGGKQARHFGAGGRVGLTNDISNRDRRYGQLSRAYALSDGITTPEEYQRLINYKAQTRGEVKQLQHVLAGLITGARRKLSKARKDKTAGKTGATAAVTKYADLVNKYSDERAPLGMDLIDYDLDLTELRGNKSEALGTSAADFAQSLSAFQSSRASALSSFGSNFLSYGAGLNADSMAAGVRYLGGGSRSSGGGLGTGRSAGGVRIVNNFQAPPPDAHTWARGVGYELRTLV